MSSRGRSSGSRSSSSRRTSSHPAPTSLSNPQPSAAKPSLFGWQETAARPAQKQSNKQSHSYPSSQTGLSGSNPAKQPATYQESIQRSHAPIPVQQIPQRGAPQSQASDTLSHSYPVSNGLSGNSKPNSLSGYGASYPQQQNNGGLSGAGYPHQQAPPPYSAVDANRPHTGRQPVNNIGNNYYHPQGPPPPYSNFPNSYGGYGGHGYNPGYSAQAPGYFGNYVNTGKSFGGMSRTGSALTGVGIAGAGVGTILTGLALWNLARSTGHHHHTVIYDNRGQPVAVAPGNSTEPVVDSVLGDLVNCTLTITNNNVSEILAIPCAIATSFTPDADVKDPHINNNTKDNTECIITVVTKTNREFMTTIPCSILLSTAASNNVTEPPILEASTEINNGTLTPLDNASNNQPVALRLSTDNSIEYNTKLNCIPELGELRDPINPCFTVGSNLTVIPLTPTDKPKDEGDR
ncbi:unnamed protein product, partial [Iphiclides podalirius]